VQKLLPPQFGVKLHKRYAIVGVCMIRFENLRPNFLPPVFGFSSENVAHRFAVTWEENGVQKEGVYIPRRDSNSILNRTLGGRVFPGFHHKSEFSSTENSDEIHILISSEDGLVTEFKGQVSEGVMEGSVFETVDEASAFFLAGATGYSATRSEGHYHGMELETYEWVFEPMSVEVAKSHFFDDLSRFPKESIALDSAFVMRNVEHQWNSRPDLFVGEQGLLQTR
ncbi:MAG TPA: DUF2071 domain-containing protein, partial [Fimbriimonas sp.]|nr:DUF2071 domain-containing protein [Fimbriimonas sp.]